MSPVSRIEREIRQIKKDTSCNLSIQIINDNLLTLKGIFNGPSDTPYGGGVFVVDIQIPEDYPYKDTRVYHPNISSQTGAICLDILKDNWTRIFAHLIIAVLTLKTALISLQSLLFDPVPDDPQDAEVASVYKQNRKLFDQTAKEWTRLYANKLPEKVDEVGLDANAISRLMEMGFDRNSVIQGLRKFTGDEQKCIEWLLSGQP